MPYPIEKRLVIAVSTSALFDMEESGVDAYRKYQEKNLDVPLNKGVAYPFIKRIANKTDSNT